MNAHSCLVAASFLTTLALAGCGGEADDPAANPVAGQPSAPSQTAASERSGRTLELQRVTLHDQGSGNMESHHLLVPKGWRQTGGVVWNVESPWNFVSVDIAVTAEDGRQVCFLPSCTFTYAEGPGMEQFLPPIGQLSGGKVCMPPPRVPAEFASQFVLPKIHPDAQDVEIVSVQELEAVAKEWNRTFAPLLESERQNNAMLAGMGTGGGTQTQIFVPLVRLRYTDGGQPFEENVSFVFVMMSSVIDSGFGQAFSNWDWSVYDVCSSRAPAGSLDSEAALLRTITASLRPTQRWQAMVNDLHQRIARMQQESQRVSMQEARKRSQITAQTGNDILDMSMDSWRKQNASTDRINQAFGNYIKGVDDYQLPDGSTQSLDSSYKNVYTDSAGTFLFTDDVNFNPNIGSTTNWDRLDPVTPTGGAANW